jgi:choline dehydrogenase-like flavoprotein
MDVQGMLLPSSNTFVDLDPERTDRFGIPLPRVHMRYGDNEIAMARDAVERCEEIIRAAGGRVLSKPAAITPANLAVDPFHWAGTTRMGADAKTSVVNTHSQTHDVRNLFIGDASVFAYYPEKNPTLTNVALSWRMSDHLVEKLRMGEI